MEAPWSEAARGLGAVGYDRHRPEQPLLSHPARNGKAEQTRRTDNAAETEEAAQAEQTRLANLVRDAEQTRLGEAAYQIEQTRLAEEAARHSAGSPVSVFL